MRVRLILAIALCVSALRAASPSEAAAVFNVFGKADANLAHFVELQRTGVTQELALVIAMGSRDALSGGAATFWSEDRKIGLFLQEKNHPERVDLLATKAGLPDCYARIERVTATDTVISCRGEKSATYPNQKWIYDIRSRKLIRQFSYQPFAMKQILSHGGGAVFIGTDGQRLVAVQYEANREPAFQVLRDAPSPHQMEIDQTLPPAGVSSFSRTTYDQFAAARPQRVKNGYRREGTQILESVGPWQRDGERIWFGKTFYDGEGETGVGGFGYFDQTAKKLRLFAPPEIVNWSVSALDVTADAVWLALVNNGEYGGSSGGLLRYDRQSGSIRRFPLPDIAFRLNHASGKILAATECGFAVVAGSQVTRYFVDQTVGGGWRVVPAIK
jgi:hypothetical protein